MSVSEHAGAATAAALCKGRPSKVTDREVGEVGRDERVGSDASQIDLVPSLSRVHTSGWRTATFVEVFVTALTGDGNQLASAEQQARGLHRGGRTDGRTTDGRSDDGTDAGGRG